MADPLDKQLVEAVLTRPRRAKADVEEARLATRNLRAAKVVLPKVKGAFSLVFMDEHTLYAARDPQGIRPLVLGRLERGWVVASETAALDIVGASFIREIEPGELVAVDEHGLRSQRFAPATPKGESSKTTQPAGGAPSAAAAARKMSGAGLGRATRGSSPHTTAWNSDSHVRWGAAFSAYRAASVLVAIAIGTPRAASARVKDSAPGIGCAVAISTRRSTSRSATRASGESGKASVSTIRRAASPVPRPMH